MHPSTLFFYLSFIVTSILAGGTLPGLPDKIYGVNLGSWCVFTIAFLFFSSRLTIWLGFFSSHGCSLMVSPFFRIAWWSLILTRDDQNGPKWAARYALIIAHHASPQNCVFSLIFLSWPTEWRRSNLKVHSRKNIQTPLTRNSKNTGKKYLLTRYFLASTTQLSSGKLGSLKNILMSLCARTSTQFAFLYVNLALVMLVRPSESLTRFFSVGILDCWSFGKQGDRILSEGRNVAIGEYSWDRPQMT